MDELLHHCLRELSFDGDLGSNVTRLKDFIVGCYENKETLISQNLDDTFCAFVWSLIAQHPTVHVGLKPPGVTSEVWIAPQASAKRKGKKGEELVGIPPSELVPIPNAKRRPLAELIQQYGDDLRIAIEPEAIYAAITGSHIRSSKLSPMVYSALQIITRGRDNGVSVVDLGQQTKYDQKTCFYLVKQLTELGLVMKVRRGGVGTHFCIHKYFFDRSPSWKAIRGEENEAEEQRKTEDKQAADAGDDLEEAAAYPDFTPIDARHLSSLPLIRARVVKLLQASKNHIHPSNNLLVTIGFASPTKTDRRFFQSRIRELLHQGVIEKVIVPNRRRKSSGSYVKCFRLVSEGNRPTEGEADFFPDADDEKDEGGQEGVKVNLTLYRQIVDLLEDAETEGMTLQDLSIALCDFDKRTIELLLSRAEKYPLPAHLKDLGIVSLMETSGRERRHRYYTARSYQALLAKEKFEHAPIVSTSNDLESAGGFSKFDTTSFYADKRTLQIYQDGFKENTRTEKPRKHPPKNPIMPDGRVKRGRPRKKPIEGTEVLHGKSPGVAEPTTPPAAVSLETRPTKRRRLGASQQEPAVADQVSRKGRQLQAAKDASPSGIVKSQKRTRSEGSSRRDAGEKELQKRIRPSGSERDNRPHADFPTPSSRQDAGELGDARVRGLEPFEPGVGDRVQAEETQYSAHIMTVLDHATPSQMPAVPGPVSGPSGWNVPVNGVAVSPTSNKASIPIDPELLVQQELSPGIEPHRPGKEASGASRAKVNVSHLRRENEVYRVIVEQGEIVNIQSKEFYVAHKALIETLSRAGEPTSAPVGTTIDKRTLAATLDNLESQGRIKQLKTSVITHTGASRPISVVYLSDLPQERLNKFLADLSRTQISVPPSSTYLKIDETVDFGTNLPSTQRGVLPVQLLQLEQSSEDRKEGWSRNVAKAKQLFSYDDNTIRSVLLTERTTLAQFFGFVVGKVARARLLHLSTLQAFESHKEVPGVICPVHRIVDLSYYCHELPLELYCSLISVSSYDEELKQFLRNGDGGRTTVRSLPTQLHSALQIGRSRARSRFLEIMEVLSSLGLVLPLQSSASENASISCVHDSYRRAFEPVAFNPSGSNSSNSFNCWCFCSQGPIHTWGLPEKAPPLWKQVPLVTEAEAQIYWRDLHEACVNPDAIPLMNIDSADLSESHVSLGRTLRRTLSWTSDYVFTWHQTQYMKQFIDIHTGKTPLQEDSGEVRSSKISRISWVVGASEEHICHFYTTSHTKLVLELEKTRDRAKQRRSERKSQGTTEAKALLARKAAEAKQQREEAWDKLLSRLHPSPLPTAALVRLKRIRTRFMQASAIQDPEKWENEILTALREADLIMRRLLKTSDTMKATPLAIVPPELQRPLNGEKSVEALIAQQGPPITPQKPKGKRKGKGSNDTKVEKRRHRFQWNHDYDELARDASAIIRARCRASSRLDWGAFEQVFPAVPRNTVRQRLAHLRESPGNEAYLNRLEERWHELWLQYRGTSVLPDDDPLSPTNFDLTKHVGFLRAHIDKNALRVGFAQPQERTSLTIPSSVDELLNEYIVAESTLQAPIWDFMWNAAVEEGREKRLMHQSFTKSPEEVILHTNLSSESVNIAEAALKMVFGTPHERYDHEDASRLLKIVGDSVVEFAKNNLLARGVLSKLVRDPHKQKPGRHLKISEMNQNAVWGPVSRDIFQDAAALEDLSRQVNGWREWPLLASDGDAARLIEAVSNNTVKFRVDTFHAQQARAQLDWNSKKADDDQIETTILVQFDASPSRQSPISDGEDEAIPGTYPSHTSTLDGTPRCCRGQTLNGLVDCQKCLEEEWQSVASTLDTEKDATQGILDLVRDSGPGGLLKPRLRAAMDSLGLTDSQMFSVVSNLTDALMPLLFWAGYDSLVLVHSIFLSNWTVVTSDGPLTRSHPRRWNDIAGNRIPDYWQAALRAVMGVIIFRPGITQYEIRWRLRSAYDRQEINDILHYLNDEGYLSFRQKDESRYLAQPLDDDEEREVFWLIGEKTWYQV